MRKIRILFKQIVIALFGKRTDLMSDKLLNEICFWIMYGRWPDFDAPETFNEYVCARKVNREDYGLSVYTDKYEVREYVRESIGEQYLNQVIGIYDSFDEIDFNNLPKSFVMKGTHGSGYNIVVPDKRMLDIPKARKKFNHWLKQNYYHQTRERNYRDIKPRIMIDAFLQSNDGNGLSEMKVFCFGGKPKFISYNLNKNGKTFTNIYDENWKLMDLQRGYEHFKCEKLPDNRFEILEVAAKLSSEFDFVRVDLYSVNEKIYFSELTFYTGAGFVPFSPAKYDKEFAHYFEEIEHA